MYANFKNFDLENNYYAYKYQKDIYIPGQFFNDKWVL